MQLLIGTSFTVNFYSGEAHSLIDLFAHRRMYRLTDSALMSSSLTVQQ